MPGCSFFNKNDTEKEFYFNRLSFDSISNLNAEIIDFDTPLNPMVFNIIHDSIILVQNWEGRPYFLSLYDMKSKKLIFEFIKRGRGPNEWLSASATHKSNYDNGFVLRDIHTNEAAHFDIDSLLLLGNSYSPKRFHVPDFAKGDIIILDSCKRLCFNLYHMGKNRSLSNSTESCLYPFDICNNQQSFDEEIEKHKYFTYNVTGGFIALSPDKSRIIVFYKHLNLIEIFNENFDLIKRLNGPMTFNPELEIRDYEFNAVSFKKRTYTYGQCFYTFKSIYVIYKGLDGLKKNMPTEVFKLDWEGNLLHRYILSAEFDIELQNLCIDSKEEYLYGTVSNWKEYPQLVKFKL